MKLRYYIAVRLGLAIPTLLILLTTVFFLMHILPGDPVVVMYGDRYPTKYLDEIRQNLGLDKPLWDQFVKYMSDLVRGDLGVSFVHKVPVIQKVSNVFPCTLEIAVYGLFFSTLLGLPLGIIAAMRRDGWFDHISRLVSLYIHSNPNFWVALIFQILFGLMLGVFPISGRSPPNFQLTQITGLYVLDSILTLNLEAFIQSIRYLTLPILTIAITSIPYLSRLSRASMINVLGEDYMVTARAKGLPQRMITYKHALRNALLPVITSLGGQFTGLLGGTVIIEKIFSMPGLGSLLLDSLTARDFTMIQGIVAIYAVVVVIMNTMIDIIYAAADPRVKF